MIRQAVQPNGDALEVVQKAVADVLSVLWGVVVHWIASKWRFKAFLIGSRCFYEKR